MKKTLLIILALFLVLTLAAGCDNSNKNASDNGGADAVSDDESLRDSGSASDTDITVDAGGMTLDDINIFDADDDASFRGGAGWDKNNLTSVADN